MMDADELFQTEDVRGRGGELVASGDSSPRFLPHGRHVRPHHATHQAARREPRVGELRRARSASFAPVGHVRFGLAVATPNHLQMPPAQDKPAAQGGSENPPQNDPAPPGGLQTLPAQNKPEAHGGSENPPQNDPAPPGGLQTLPAQNKPGLHGGSEKPPQNAPGPPPRGRATADSSLLTFGDLSSVPCSTTVHAAITIANITNVALMRVLLVRTKCSAWPRASRREPALEALQLEQPISVASSATCQAHGAKCGAGAHEQTRVRSTHENRLFAGLYHCAQSTLRASKNIAFRTAWSRSSASAASNSAGMCQASPVAAWSASATAGAVSTRHVDLVCEGEVGERFETRQVRLRRHRGSGRLGRLGQRQQSAIGRWPFSRSASRSGGTYAGCSPPAYPSP